MYFQHFYKDSVWSVITTLLAQKCTKVCSAGNQMKAATLIAFITGITLNALKPVCRAKHMERVKMCKYR